MNKLYVVGIGPGSKENMTFKAVDAIKEAQTIVAYTKYLDYVCLLYTSPSPRDS